MGRFSAGVVIASLLLPVAARAATAPSLSARIHIDGVLDEYTPDEFVLDASSALPERDSDSAWGTGNDISRVAITWDHDFLYLGVEGRLFDTAFAAFIANRAGGLRTLEDAGEFRRAIELPGFPVNLMALVDPRRVPDVARADDSHPFSLVDENALRRAVAGVRGGVAGFEMAVPWSMLVLAQPVRVVTAITGEPGTGAGDCAPDASAQLDDDRYRRAVLDRSIVLIADADRDGVPDDSIATRDAAAIEGGVEPVIARDDATLEIAVSPRTIAPDRGDEAVVSFRIDTDAPVFMSAAVYSMDGERVRALFAGQLRTPGANGAIVPGPDDAWDGRNDRGDIVRGGAYVVVADWGFARGERAGRAKTAVVVVR